MSALNKFLIFFTLAFLCSSAVAQSTSLEDRDFEGTFQLKNSEALLTLERRSTGMLNGALGTASDKVYFTVSVHGDYAVGEYEYGDSHVEITLQPQPDGNTMFFWLKDASTAEEDYAAYAAVRQEGAAGASLPNTVPAGIDAPESQIEVSPFMRTAADSAPGDLAGTWYALSSPEQGLSILIVLNLA